MSIRLIAQALYRLHQEVDALERGLAAAPMAQKRTIEDALRKKRAEYARMKAALEGRKNA